MGRKPIQDPIPAQTADNGISIAAARKRLADEQQQRLATCAKELEAVLERHGFALIGVPFVRQDGGIGANVQVVPAPPKSSS